MSDVNVTVVSAAQRAEQTVTTGTKAWELFRRRPRRHRRPHRRRAARSLVRAGRRRRGRAGRDRLGRRARHPSALDRPCDGAGCPGAVSRREARHRPADHRRVLLRLRRRRAVQARRPRPDRVADAQDRQRGAAVLAARRRRRRCAGRARRRAVQARADRDQGLRSRRRRRRCRRRGRRRPADHLRQPQARRLAGMEGPLPRPAPADHQADPGLQVDAVGGGVLAWRREEQATATHLRHRLGDQGGARRAPRIGSRRPSGATTAGSDATSTCTASPTSSAPAWRCSIRRAA